MTALPHDSTTFPPIPQQDYANIPVQQVVDGHLTDAPPKKLGKAMVELSGNFEGPIRDLGF